MTSATERLRALLDERGVEWWPMHDDEVGYREDRDTEFLVYGCKHVAHEWGCRLQVDMLTPEQAVAATLGPGTCEVECFDDGVDEGMDGEWYFETPTWYLSCGHEVCGSMRPCYCSTCGRRVVG